MVVCTRSADGGVPDEEGAAARLATEALDSFRDEVHRERMDILWCTGEGSEAPLPAAAEVYLIRGYIDYTCTRFVLRDGALRVQSVQVKRTWFYNPKGERYLAEEFQLPAAAFSRAWRAAGLLIGAKAVPLRQPARPEIDESGAFMVSASYSRRSSSHEPHVWVRLRGNPNLSPEYEGHVRGEKRRDGIQDFDELRTRAVFRVFSDMLPQGRDAPRGTPFPLTEWAPFLTEEVRAWTGRIPDDLTQEDLGAGDDLPLETSLRILGETGHEPALPVVNALQDRLTDATEKKTYKAWCIRREAGYARTKIRLLTRWDAAEAVRLIHGNPRHWHADNDLAKWMRARLFERDPEAYFSQLVADTAEQAHDAALLRDTVAELAARYPGRALAEIRGLLDHASPEVAADAAFVLLRSRPDDAAALTVLDRLAGDTAVKIPSHDDWFQKFARVRALDYMRSEGAPESVRWSSQRVRRQLAQPGEDGRMVHCLLSALDILGDPAGDEEKAGAYRRVLSGPRNKGVLVACEELIELEDRASAPAIRRALDEIAADCNKGFSWKPDPQALYPWTDKYDLERIRESLGKLEGP